MHSFAPFSNLKLFVKICWKVCWLFANFRKFCHNFADFFLNFDQFFRYFPKMQHLNFLKVAGKRYGEVRKFKKVRKFERKKVRKFKKAQTLSSTQLLICNPAKRRTTGDRAPTPHCALLLHRPQFIMSCMSTAPLVELEMFLSYFLSPAPLVELASVS
jgi:hypothetical protein